MELDYLKIKTSGGYMYGGDQKLFGKKASRSGCGMIAACDMLLYLDGRNAAPIPFKEYADFAENFRDNVAYKNTANILGIFPHRLVKMLNECSGKRFFEFYGRKKFRGDSGKSLAEFIGKSLENGLPVIVRVGANGKSLPYEIRYPASGNKLRKGMVSWHYITVTGISEKGQLTFSSWGGKGIMSCADLQNHFGFTGGVIAESQRQPSKTLV